MPFERTMLRRALAIAGTSVTLLVAVTAAADPSFPGAVAKKEGMPCVPQCTLCHNTESGGPANLRPRGLVVTLNSDGLSVSDLSSINDALDEDERDKSDSDSDGIPDIEELKAGTDPSDPTSGASLCGPTYGCVRVAPGGRVDGIASASAGAVAVIGIALLRRRRQRSRSR